MSECVSSSSAMILKTPSAFDATVAGPKKNPVSGDSGSLAQEIMCGYVERRGLLPTVQTQGMKVCKGGKTVFMPLDLLPTPMASNARNGSSKGQGQGGRIDRKIAQGRTIELHDMATLNLLPTPSAIEGTKYTKTYNPNSQNGVGLTALAVNGMLPTPRARDYKGAGAHGEGGMDLATAVTMREYQDSTGSLLNPLFVAEMMGFPVEYLVLPFLDGESNPSKPSATP